MIITLNDQEIEIPTSCTLQEVLNRHVTASLNFAVSLNHQLIHRGSYQNHKIEPQDRIDIILPMQGG